MDIFHRCEKRVLGNEKKAYLVYDMNMNEDFSPFKMICEDTIKLDKKNNKNISEINIQKLVQVVKALQEKCGKLREQVGVGGLGVMFFLFIFLKLFVAIKTYWKDIKNI